MASLKTLSLALAALSALITLLGCNQSTGGASEHTITQYKSYCSSCHEVGAANAPRRGDVHQWGKRLRKGEVQLVASIKKGLVAMPPNGGCATCSDEDFRALIQYMSHE